MLVDCAKFQPLSLSLHTRVGCPCTCTNVRLLGPWFKTRKRKPFHPHPQSTTPSSSIANQQFGQHQLQRPYCKQSGKCRVACPDFLCFHFSKFKYSLTMLLHSYASFPHSTCTLYSVMSHLFDDSAGLVSHDTLN